MKRWLWLTRTLALRSWRRHPVRQLLSALSIALGVAMFLSTELTTGAITRAFEEAASAVQSEVDLLASRDAAGLSADELDALRALPEFAGVSGVVQVETRYQGGTPLTLLGVDPAHDASVRSFHEQVELAEGSLLAFLTDPQAILLTRRFLELAGLEVGQQIELTTARGRRSFTIGAAVEFPEPLRRAAAGFGFLPLNSAQRLFGREGRVDQADLRLAEGVSLEQGRSAALECLPDGALVRTPATLNAEIMAPLAGFRGIQRMNGLLALLIGIFLVFNSVSAAVAERTRDAGLWRALGMTRGGLLLLFVLEALVLAALGFVGGLFLGLGVARATVGITEEVISTVHFQVPPMGSLVLTPALVGAAAVLAILATLVATGSACLGLVKMRPLEILASMAVRRTRERLLRRMGLAGVALLLFSLVLALLPAAREIPAAGRITALTLPLSVALIAPALVIAVAGRVRRWLFMRTSPPVWLAVDALRAHPARTALAVVAFALSLGLVVGHGGATRAMHSTLHTWLDRSIPGGVLIHGVAAEPLSPIPFNESAVAGLTDLPGVEELFRLRFRIVHVEGEVLMCVASDLDIIQRRARPRFTVGEADEIFERCRTGPALYVSDNYMWRSGVEPGDLIPLSTPSGVVRLPVVGAIHDYHHPNGALFLDIGLYRELFDDPMVDYAELCLAEGVDQASVATAALERLPEEYAFLGVTTRDEFLSVALGFMEDVKKLSYAQLILAIIIGVVGILATVTLSILSRSRELSLVRAVGMDRQAMRRTVLWEVAGLALAATLAGVVVGNLFFLPANLLFRELSGFTFEHVWPWQESCLAVLVAALAAGLATILPLRLVEKVDVLAGIGSE